MAITTAIAALKGTYELVSTAIDARDYIKLMELKITMLQQIASVMDESAVLRESNTTLKQRLSEVESEMKRLQDTNADIENNYERVTLGFGATLYRSKPGVAKGNAPEYLCANCVSEGKKRYLQPVDLHGTFECPNGHGRFFP
ncbi:hypothetical protein [Burkholderia glumae]|uniref:hypothetical protein n=1 Tax=Burkholderia glumae TaxID=337 RepID=UPI00214F988E|nr:hypothetical protein [Burkholderia glumae]